MRILIASIGSSGDIHPYIGVGVVLRTRGHEVVFLANPHFRARIEAAGLHFEPLGTADEYTAMVTNPLLVHPSQGPRFVIRELIAATCRPMFDAVARIARDFRADLVFRHHIAFGARWAAEKLDLPCATGVLCPIFWFSRTDPPVFKRGVLEHAPAWLLRLRLSLGRVVMPLVADPIFNPLRREVGLSPVRGTFGVECRAGVVNLGLWSPHFRPPLDDDPPHARVCGFSFFDRAHGDEHAPHEVEEFLERCERAGRRPVVFTMGTSVVHHAREIYAQAADACATLGLPALLLVGRPEYAPAHLPADVGAFTYAPYSAVFPRAAAVVHHGGVGTTGATMRAGVPSVILPFANDEFDNAARARRLGVSITVHTTPHALRGLPGALRSVATDPALAARAATLGSRIAPEDGARTAAEELERVAAGR